MGRKKKQSNKYWTKITEIAVTAYNETADRPSFRERIYKRFLFPALMKMSENLINKMKPDYIDSSFQDLQTDLVTYLTERLCKFNPNAGKAYSYYTRTAFNYLIAENQKGYAKLKNNLEPVNIDDERNVLTELAVTAYNLSEPEPVLRERIYRRFLFPALMKMAENLINKMKPDYIDS